MIRFPLPFRSAPRNFKDPIVKRAAKNPRNHVAFASANGGGVLCRLKQPGIRPLSLLSVVSLCEWEIQRQLCHFKFWLPQRKPCVWHPSAVALTILMEIRWKWGNLSPRRKWWKTRETLYLKGLFSEVVSFILTFPASLLAHHANVSFQELLCYPLCAQDCRVQGRVHNGAYLQLLERRFPPFTEP